MFGNYAIATDSCHPSSIPCRDLVSPYLEAPRKLSMDFPRHMSISQLSQRFSEQRLQHDAMSHVRSEPSPMNETTSDMNTPESRMENSYVVGSKSASRRRLQRQQGVRMLCESSHLRSIQEMVDRMVRSGSQCAVSSPPRTTSISEDELPDPKDDEGYSSFEENDASRHRSTSPSSPSIYTDMQYKRSTDLSVKGASVCKNVRLRKTRNRKDAHRSL